MPAVAKPPRHRGVRERYAAARQGFLEHLFTSHMRRAGEWFVTLSCQCRKDCPRRCTIERVLMGGEREGWYRYRTDGHVHHVRKRSTNPDVRDDPTNLRLLDRFCHQKEHGR